MDQLIDIMRDALKELEGINTKLEHILGYGGYNSIAEIYQKLETFDNYISGVKDDVSSINGRLETINSSIDDIREEVSNVCSKLEDVDSSINSVESAVNSVESSIDSLERY